MTSASRDQAADSGAMHIALPPERFYWAVLDTRTLPPRHRRNAQSLGFLLENTLPVPIESVHAIYHWNQSENANVIACAMAKDDLRVSIDEHRSALTLSPETLPAFVSTACGDASEPHSLNLLTGEFEPLPLRRAKRRMLTQSVAAIVIVTALAPLGIERRIAAVRERAAELRSTQAQVIVDTLGNTVSASSRQPPELRFLAELRTLRQTRSPQTLAGGESSPSIGDVTPTLADLLTRWPADLHALTELISITPTSMTLRALVPVTSDAQTLADSLSNVGDHVGGWSLLQPQINAAPPQGVNATLQWKREDQPRSQRKEGAS